MAETPFVSKLKTYQNSIRNNGPQDFSLGMMKANDVLYERIFLFSLAITQTRVIAKKLRTR